MNFNQAIVCGRLTRDPECVTLPSGQLTCTFTVATNRKYTDSEGDRQEQTEFHTVVTWAKQAETIKHYATKATLIWVAGHLQTRTGPDKAHTEVPHYRTEIIADSFNLGPKTDKATAHESPERTVVPQRDTPAVT